MTSIAPKDAQTPILVGLYPIPILVGLYPCAVAWTTVLLRQSHEPGGFYGLDVSTTVVETSLAKTEEAGDMFQKMDGRL